MTFLASSSLGNGDGVAGNLVLKRADDLVQGAEGVARVLLGDTKRTNSVVAGFAEGVYFHADVPLAAGHPLCFHLPLQRIMNRD